MDPELAALAAEEAALERLKSTQLDTLLQHELDPSDAHLPQLFEQYFQLSRQLREVRQAMRAQESLAAEGAALERRLTELDTRLQEESEPSEAHVQHFQLSWRLQEVRQEMRALRAQQAARAVEAQQADAGIADWCARQAARRRRFTPAATAAAAVLTQLTCSAASVLTQLTCSAASALTLLTCSTASALTLLTCSAASALTWCRHWVGSWH